MPMADLIQMGIQPGPTLHVGAHVGEEAQAYAAFGFAPVWWIEANEDVIPQLEKNLAQFKDQHVVCALVSDSEREVTFHIASNGQSSSYMELGTHATEHPDVTYVDQRALLTTTVDSLWKSGDIEQASYLSMDVQGTELDVLLGAERFLAGVDTIYAEVNTADVYRGCAQEPEVTAFLAARGFRKVREKLTVHSWGDALYSRA